VRRLQRGRSRQRSTSPSMTQLFSTTPTGLSPACCHATWSPESRRATTRTRSNVSMAPCGCSTWARRTSPIVAEIQRWLADGDATPDLADEDRGLLLDRLETPRPLLTDRGVAEQLLHGEPHRGTCSPRSTDRSSSTSRTAPAGRSSSTLRGFPTRSASAIGTLTRSWSASAGGSYWRSSQRTAGVETTNTPAADSQALRSSTSCGEGPPWPALDAILLVAPSRRNRETGALGARDKPIPSEAATRRTRAR
jgi:hypothetical protein